MQDTENKSLTPNLPTYSNVRHFLRILDGTSYVLYRRMYKDIWEQRGNPQEQASWTDPDSWIPQRLNGEEQDLASAAISCPILRPTAAPSPAFTARL